MFIQIKGEHAFALFWKLMFGYGPDLFNVVETAEHLN